MLKLVFHVSMNYQSGFHSSMKAIQYTVLPLTSTPSIRFPLSNKQQYGNVLKLKQNWMESAVVWNWKNRFSLTGKLGKLHFFVMNVARGRGTPIIWKWQECSCSASLRAFRRERQYFYLKNYCFPFTVK